MTSEQKESIEEARKAAFRAVWALGEMLEKGKVNPWKLQDTQNDLDGAAELVREVAFWERRKE